MKVYSKDSTPINYARNIDGTLYKMKIDQSGFELSPYPENVIEDLFATWGKHLFNEEQFLEYKKSNPTIQETSQATSVEENKVEEKTEEVQSEPVVEQQPEVATFDPLIGNSVETSSENTEEEKNETEDPNKHRKSNFGRGRK